MKLKIIDAIGVGLIVIAIVMTALNLIAARGPSTEVSDFTIHEIDPAPPPPWQDKKHTRTLIKCRGE